MSADNNNNTMRGFVSIDGVRLLYSCPSNIGTLLTFVFLFIYDK